jgi:hypothetical protein
METTQSVSTPTSVQSEPGKMADLLRLATVWADLKPERVQDSLTTDPAGTTVSLSLEMAVHLPQTVTFGLVGAGLSITFSNAISNP